MTLPDLKAKATLNTTEWRKGAAEIQTDLRAIEALSKRVGTLKITADLAGARDFQTSVGKIRTALTEVVPTDLQRRIEGVFAGFDVGAATAKQSASVFEAQAAALRARINELSNGVRLARAEFQSGLGEATPEEIAALSARMRTLQTELGKVGQEAKETFGEWSNEALKASMATRTAVSTVEAANGRISRLGLASQVKLGVSEALTQAGPQAGAAANSFVQLARGFDQSRISGKLFETQLKNNNVQLDAGKKAAQNVADTLKLTTAETEGAIGRLVRQGFSIQQASAALERAGASAKLNNATTAQGIENYVSAVEAGDSAMLASIGVSENLSTYQQKLAKQLGKTTDELTKGERAQAAYNLIMAAASDELDLYRQSQDGLTGSSGDLELSLKRAQLALGESLLPAVNVGTRLLLGFTDAFTKLPEPIQATTGLLLLSAVAVGVLYAPISLLVNGYRALTGARAAATVGAAAETVAETALTGAVARQNVAMTLRNVLLADVGPLWAKATTTAMLYSGGMNVATGSTLGFAGALGVLQKAAAGLIATNIFTLLAVGVGALALYQAQSVKETTAIYEAADQANQTAFEKTMARVKELRAAGTELGRAQARVLLLQLQLQQAQEAPVIGVNALTGERIYGKVDQARVKQLQADLVGARENVTLLFTEAQRRGTLNLKLTEDQTKAVKSLREALEGRAFDLKVSGMTELGATLAKLGKDYEKLRTDFKKPFVVNGKLMDPAQTPALRDGLASLDAQQAQEVAAARTKYAKEAAEAARKSALDVQKAEIAAMQEGRAKRQAERQAELAEITRAAKEEADKYKDFPAQKAKILADGQKEITAKRRQFAREDEGLARENAKRVQDAERTAQDSAIAALKDGYVKEELTRRMALNRLRQDVAERVRLLSGDPAAQQAERQKGDAEIAAQVAANARARTEEYKKAAQDVYDAQVGGQQALIDAMADGYAKEEAQRALNLAKLKRDVAERVKAEAGRPDVQRQVASSGQAEIAAREAQDARARAQAIRTAGLTVAAATREARAAEIATIQDADARTRAQTQATREQEVAEVRRTLAERLKALNGFPAQQAKILADAQRLKVATERRYAQEDADEARQRALRIAAAIQTAQNAQFGAEQAGRGNASAQYELRLTRQLNAVRENAVQVAQIEQGAIAERARFAQESADAQYRQDARNLQTNLTRALSDTKLSVQERKNLWRGYYADLNKLDQDYRAGNAGRLKQQTTDAQAAAEALRAASLAQSSRPIQASEGRVQELQNRQALARSDAETLRINQQISAERDGQLTALRGQLIGLGGVILNADQRRDVESKIKGIQHDQAVALQAQKDAQRDLRQSALDRLDAEAQYAERIARTDAALLLARQRSKAALQARLSELDSQISGENREVERNALLNQRLQLLGQIQDAQDKIDAMPGEAEQRRVAALSAQRAYLLEVAGLSDNAVARAQSSVAAAQDEVTLAQQRLALARTQADQEAAQTDLTSKRTALLSAQRDLSKARNDEENKALDVLEARARAELQLRGLADDAVASAQLDLDVTRQRLALVGRELARGGLSTTDQTALQQRQVELTGQQAEQERKLAAAQRDRVRLLEGLADAQRSLSQELDGSARRATPLQRAYQGIADARTTLARAERDYQTAQASAAPEQQRTATDALTSAIKAQRDAVSALADEYRRQISSMDAVQQSAAKLSQAAYGEGGKGYSFAREAERLRAIQTRRDAAQQALARALQTGQADQISKAADELAQQEDRYQKQAALMEKNGSQITRQGESTTRRLADQVDALGIQYDREAVALDTRARIVDQEAQAVQTFGQHVGEFAQAAARIPVTLPAPSDLAGQLDRQLVAQVARLVQTQAPPSVPATAPVTHNSYVLNVGGLTINAPSDRAPDIEGAVNRALDNRIDAARRDKAWSDKKC